MSKALDALLVALAALRMTRFFTSDTLGEWLAVGPAKRWAARRTRVGNRGPAGPTFEEFREFTLMKLDAEKEGDPAPSPPAKWGKAAKLVSMFDCPFCIGFHVGWVLIALTLAARATKNPLVLASWRALLAALGLNYVTGHISARLD